MKQRIIRISLSIILLYFVWQGNRIAIAVSITLNFISFELLSYLIDRKSKDLGFSKEIEEIFKNWY